MKKGKLKVAKDGNILFYCPGCKEMHSIYVDEKYSYHWNFNNNYDKPTFSPSVLIQSGHYANGYNSDKCWCTWNKEHPDKPAPFKCGVCHSFVTDGRIQYLSDCTHELAGQTVDMVDPDFDE